LKLGICSDSASKIYMSITPLSNLSTAVEEVAHPEEGLVKGLGSMAPRFSTSQPSFVDTPPATAVPRA
jgi:hypothetical protein